MDLNKSAKGTKYALYKSFLSMVLEESLDPQVIQTLGVLTKLYIEQATKLQEVNNKNMNTTTEYLKCPINTMYL